MKIYKITEFDNCATEDNEEITYYITDGYLQYQTDSLKADNIEHELKEINPEEMSIHDIVHVLDNEADLWNEIDIYNKLDSHERCNHRNRNPVTHSILALIALKAIGEFETKKLFLQILKSGGLSNLEFEFEDIAANFQFLLQGTLVNNKEKELLARLDYR